MLKTYQHQFQLRSLLIEVEGENKRISFTGGTSHNGGRFTTSDEELQKVLENHPEFLSGEFFVAFEHGKEDRKENTNVEDAVSDEKKEDKLYPEANTVQKAAQVLVKEYGVNIADVRVKKDVLAKATELGISFPNLSV